MNLEITRIGPEEYGELSALLEWRRTGREGADTSRYQSEVLTRFMEQRQVLQSDSFFIYAAKVNGKFVGYVNAMLIPKPDPRLGVMYVDELWTAPSYRGQGIASALLCQVSRLARALHLWRVRLYVSRDNASARACYRKVGFAEKDDCLFCEMDVAEIRLP